MSEVQNDRPVIRGAMLAALPRWLKAVLLLAVVGAMLAVFAWRSTQPMAQAADRFLAANAAMGAAGSYRMASPNFRQAVAPDAWSQLVSMQRLDRYRTSSWTQREVDANGSGRLAGTITLDDGSSFPVELRMVKSGSDWQVLSIGFTGGGVATGDAGRAATNGTGPPRYIASSAASTTAPPDPAAALPDPIEVPQGSEPAPTLPAAVRPTTLPATSTADTIPWSKAAGECMAILETRFDTTLEGITCPTDLAAVPGTILPCRTRRAGRPATLWIKLDAYDPASRHEDISCRVSR